MNEAHHFQNELIQSEARGEKAEMAVRTLNKKSMREENMSHGWNKNCNHWRWL
ncbi:hypothetical protein ACEOWG_001546 [Bacillus cereus]